MKDGLVKFVCIGGPWASEFIWLGNDGKTLPFTITVEKKTERRYSIGTYTGRYVKRDEKRYSFDGGEHRTLGVHWEETAPHVDLFSV